MALLNDPDQLSQGTLSAETIVWSTAAGGGPIITLGGAGLPAISTGEFFEIRDHSVAVNNGLYRESGGAPSTTSVVATKVSGANPSTAPSEAVTWLGDSNTLAKNVHFDTAGSGIYLLEQQGLIADGVLFNALYSFTKEEWKDDDFLKQFTLPMFAIDLDAGKYRVGTDGANPNGWAFVDSTGFSVRTRKLLRNAGWAELDANGNTLKIYSGILTLGTFEDSTGDTAYYEFGSDTTVDNTVDYDFAGPVNEAILAFEEQAQTDLKIVAQSLRRTGGSFITEGYKVGGSVTVRSAESTANDGTYLLSAVASSALTTTQGPFSTNSTDSSAILAVDNLTAFKTKIRVRDADPFGKTYDASDLAAINKTTLGNFVFAFPLSNVTDLKISATDATVDASTIYNGMSITYLSTAVSSTGLVGGLPSDFGISIDADGGRTTEVYEFVQRQLRKLTDIDADADVAIGRAMDDLLVFEGDILVAGKSLPTNPDGGGAGVRVININSVDQNDLRMFDNLGAQRQFPETVSITLDFNQALIDDSLAEYTLFFDRTIRNAVDATFVVTAGSGPTGTFVSTAQFPAALDAGVGAYVRVAGLTGADIAMNGIYQVTALTSTSLWSVERYDGATITTTAGAAASIDEHPIDSPDAIIVNDSTSTPITGLASADVNVNFDFDGNVQGGRVVSTTTFVVGRAIGLATAQFVQSSVQSIATGTPLTVVLTASGELNYVNV